MPAALDLKILLDISQGFGLKWALPAGSIRPRHILQGRKNRMVAKKILGLILILVLALGFAAPLAAAEKTFEIEIPGCTS